MKYIIMIVATIYMAACSTNQGGGSGGSSGASPASITAPIPLPQPNNDSSPPPPPSTIPTCSAFIGTKWVASGQPILTSASSDQLSKPPYVSSFDLTSLHGDFIESQYVGAPLNYLTCQRNFFDGVPSSNGSTSSLVWTNTDGYCGSMISWFQFDTTTCNVLKVTLRDGNGNVYLTQNYIPAN